MAATTITHEVRGTLDGEPVVIPAFTDECPPDASEAVQPGMFGTGNQAGQPHVVTVCPECADDWCDYELNRDDSGTVIFYPREEVATS